MRNRNRWFTTAAVIASSLCGAVQAQVPYLVRDIESARFGSSPKGYAAIDSDTVFFSARNGEHGRELWRSDGTPGGTRLVRDILPGPESSLPLSGVAADGIYFFTAKDRDHGRELWRSDGTEAGTFLLRDFFPGTGSSLALDIVVGDGVVFFDVATPEHGRELWRSDGTTGGTVLVVDLVPGPESSFAEPQLFHRGRLYFTALDAAHGLELWVSDGTAEGTALLADIVPGPPGAIIGSLAALGDRVCFTARGDLWCTDGTTAGTALVRDFAGSARDLVAAGDRLYFELRVPGETTRWWSSDGTAAGTVPLPGDFGRVREMTPFGGRLLFTASDGVAGTELWSSDGSEAGTRMVRDIRPGPEGSSPVRLAVYGDRLAFLADDGVHGQELWTTDGTEDGTVLVIDLTPGDAATEQAGLVGAAGRIWFSFRDPAAGYEPWISDGTAAGTSPLGPLGPEFTGPSTPRDLVPFGDGWLFSAEDEAHGRELWFTDATTAGTRLVRDLNPGGDGGIVFSEPAAVLGSQAYFQADDGVHGRALWSTDGTAAGTRLVRDIDDEGDGARLRELSVAGDRLFFVAVRDLGEELWASDGSEEGTVAIFAREGGRVCAPMPLAGGVAFVVTGVEDRGLWWSDGSWKGTVLLRHLHLQCPRPTAGTRLRVIDGVLYFDVPGLEGERPGLWRSDGTEAGTVPAIEVPGLVVEGPAAAVGGRIAFAATDAQHGSEPRITDESAAGASLLVDANPGQADSHPEFLASIGAATLFAATTTDHGHELWRTDGTPAGTRRIADLLPGPSSSIPEAGVVVGSRFFFAAFGDGTGRELFVSDGRAEGTRLLFDMAPGLTSSTEHEPHLAHDDRRLLFAGSDSVRGSELWALDTLCFFGGRPLYLHDGRFRVDACWRDARDRIGVGTGMALTDEAGAFSFFNPDNLDLGIKVIDGRRVNGEYWFFFAALTDVAGKVRVTDTENGRYRDFELEPGEARSFAAVDGFPAEQPVSARLPAAEPPPPPGPLDGGCGDGSGELCVQDGRFRVRVAWETVRGAGVGHAARTGANSGTFYFFRPDNVELMIKVHDGRPRNGHFWVFFGALSNVRYTVTVTDLETGNERVYESPQGSYTSVTDTRAFPG